MEERIDGRICIDNMLRPRHSDNSSWVDKPNWVESHEPLDLRVMWVLVSNTISVLPLRSDVNRDHFTSFWALILTFYVKLDLSTFYISKFAHPLVSGLAVHCLTSSLVYSIYCWIVLDIITHIVSPSLWYMTPSCLQSVANFRCVAQSLMWRETAMYKDHF